MQKVIFPLFRQNANLQQDKKFAMDWSSFDEEKQAEMILTSLLHLAMADNDFNSRELKYIKEVAKRIGYDNQRLEALIHSGINQGISPPHDESTRMSILYYMLFLMKADGKIKKTEEDLIYKFGFKLGFNELLIRDLIQVLKSFTGEKLPPQQLISKIRKYLN